MNGHRNGSCKNEVSGGVLEASTVEASCGGKGSRASAAMPATARRVLWDRIWDRLLSPPPHEVAGSRDGRDVSSEQDGAL